MMARTKSNLMSTSNQELYPQPSTSTTTPCSSDSPDSLTTANLHKRRLDYDSQVESGADESKPDELDTHQAKRMRTRSVSKLESRNQTPTSAPLPAGKGMRASSQSHLAYFNTSELPPSTWLVADDLDWCVVNNLSLITEAKDLEGSMYFQSPYFNEFLEIHGLEVMGNVDLQLECGEVLHIEDAVYINSAKYNLFSVQSLKSQTQNPLNSDSDYCLRKHKDHLYLFDESDGERILLTRKLANRTVLLTKDPSIQEVTEFALKHKIRDNKKVWIKEL